MRLVQMPGHAADEAEVVDDFGGVGEHLRDVHAALAIFLEFEGGGEEGVDVIGLVDFDAAGEGFAGHFVKEGLGIEEIHLAGAAVLDELDDGFGLGGEMDGAGVQIRIDGGRGGLEEAGEGDAAEAKGRALEELAAG